MRYGKPDPRSALGDGALEQSFGARRTDEIADARRARGIAVDGHPFRIAAEARNVLLHPFEGCGLIHQSVVTGGVAVGLFGEFGMREKAERTEAIVDGHDDDALLREGLAVGRGRCAGAAGVSAGVNPEQHGPFFGGRLRGGPDVEVEAVLAHFGCGATTCAATAGGLHAHGAEFIGFANAVPMRCRLRRAPAQLIHGGRGERQSLENTHIGIRPRYARNHSAVEMHRGIDGGKQRGGSREGEDKGFH